MRLSPLVEEEPSPPPSCEHEHMQQTTTTDIPTRLAPTNPDEVALQHELLRHTAFSSPLLASSLPALGTASAVVAAAEPSTLEQPAPTTPTGTLNHTLQLIETNAHNAAQLAAVSAHAAHLESQLRAQHAAVEKAEAARQEAVAAQTKLAREVADISLDKQRISVQLEHYMGRSDDLVSERGVGMQQLADLGRQVANERMRGRLEVSELQAVIRSLEQQAEDDSVSRRVLTAQNAALHADLKEVMTLMDQLEGEPGFVHARLRGSPVGRRIEAAALKLATRETIAAAAEPDVVGAVLSASLGECEQEMTRLRGALAEALTSDGPRSHPADNGSPGLRRAGRSRGAEGAVADGLGREVSGDLGREEAREEELRLLQEENGLLEAQLEMLSEKM